MAENVRMASERARPRVWRASEASDGGERSEHERSVRGREREPTWTSDDTLMEHQSASASGTPSSGRSNGVPVSPPRVVRIVVSGGDGREGRRLRRGLKAPSMKAGPAFCRRLVKTFF